MPQLEREIVKARAARLRQAAAERAARWLDGLIGTRQPVLIENSEKGHTDGFAPIAIAGIEARRPWHWPRSSAATKTSNRDFE